MAVLKAGQAKYPFWGLAINYITGLDTLGLQTTSEATYSYLLPGVSNLTNRMRYYGFYCWLLDLYVNRQKKASKKDQFRFIRRAEFLVSVIMATESPTTFQITGSNYTKPYLLHHTGSSVDLAEGADREEGKATYFKFPSGAFGQYYLGPMITLGWIITVSSTEDAGDFIYKNSTDRPDLPVSGHQMAEAFGKEISKEAENIFYNAIAAGRVAKKDIPYLYENFYLDSVNQHTEEWNCYHKVLTGKDHPLEIDETKTTYHRRNTIRDILQYSSSENQMEWNWLGYLDSVYQQKPICGEGAEETRTGWYYYQLNEYWHFAAGTIFWVVLVELRNRVYDQHLDSFVKELSDMSFKSYQAIDPRATNDKTFREVIESIPANVESELIDSIGEEIHDGNHKRALGLGWLLLFTLMRQNEKQLRELDLFAQHRRISRDGSAPELFMTLFEQDQKPLTEFLHDFLLRNIINRHQYVAIRKMGNGTTCTFKFLVEERYIRFREVTTPRFTSPRLNALSNLVFDLGVTDAEKKVTKTGKYF